MELIEQGPGLAGLFVCTIQKSETNYWFFQTG